MAAKTPKKFRQARKAARKDAKKIFSGKTQAGLKDKNPLNKFSADDVKALSEVKDEAKGKFITDDRGNKIRTTNVTPQEGAAEFKRTRAASMEEFRSKMRAEFGEYGGKKATQADYDSNPKFKDRALKASPDKPTPKTTAAGKVRSAVTVNELKPQGKVVKKAVVKKAVVKKAVPTKAAKPTVAKKGFSAGKQLNAEGKAMYDKFIKEGVKPQSALNKALFRQEKGAKVAAKAAGPIAIAAKKAAAKTAPIKVKSTVVSSKPNVPGKELAIRPKPGAVVAKAASSSAKKKFTAKGAALGAAKGAGKLLTGKVALAATIGSLALGPIQRKLSEGTKGRTTYDNLNAIAERSKKDGTVYTRSGDKPMQNASYGRAVPGAGGATIASIPKANAGTPRKETQKLRGPITGPTMDYKVENKDTLSAIAKRSGITLSELMALNKKIKDPRKIYRNTNIKIPAPGKVPDPMYTGPVPYRPGSKAAIAYEALRASRKK